MSTPVMSMTSSRMEKLSMPTVKGLHVEFLIENYTDEDIVVENLNNETFVIKPLNCVRGACNPSVIIEKCILNKPSNDALPKSQNAKEEISYMEFNPYYEIKELGVILGPASKMQNVLHPRSDEALQTRFVQSVTVDDAKNTPEVPFIVFTANSPKHTIDSLWLSFCGICEHVEVSDLPASEDTFTITFKSGQRILKSTTYPLNSVLDADGGTVEFDKNLLCAIGRTERESRTAYINYVRSCYKKCPFLQREVDRAVQAVTEEKEKYRQTAIKQEASINKLEVDLAERASIVQRLKMEALEKDNAIAGRDRTIEILRASNTSCFERDKMRYDYVNNQEQMRFNYANNQEKIEQARINTKIQHIKKEEVAWKIFGGAAIAVGTLLITKLFDKR